MATEEKEAKTEKKSAKAEKEPTDLAPLEATATEDTGPIDSTPGANPSGEVVEDDGIPEVIPVGTWVRLADTEAVEDAGATPGSLAYVVESPTVLVGAGESDLSPRAHVEQAEDAEYTVRERGYGSREFTLTADDFETTSTSGRTALLPHG